MPRIYVDGITSELIIIAGGITIGYPAFMELYRTRNNDTGTVIIQSMHSDKHVIGNFKWQRASDAGDTPYASLDAFWDALTPYFSI